MRASQNLTFAQLILKVTDCGGFEFDWTSIVSDNVTNKILKSAENATSMLRHYQLDDWRFVFDERATSRHGVCKYSEQTIALSMHTVRSHHHLELEDTVRHEVAHAVVGTWLINGYQVHHGKEWQAIAMLLGARGQRCKKAVYFEKEMT